MRVSRVEGSGGAVEARPTDVDDSRITTDCPVKVARQGWDSQDNVSAL